MTIEAAEFSRYFLAAFFTFVAGFYTLRVLYLGKTRGQSPVYMGDTGSRHWQAHLAFRSFRVTIWLVSVGRLVMPGLDAGLLPFYGLWLPGVILAGNILLGLAFAFILYLHFYMGRSWQSGVLRQSNSVLVQTGPFARSRNPMMLGVLVCQLGLFLSLPSLFTLVCLVVGIWGVLTQVRVEEAVLQQRFGEAYGNYAAVTPRWLGFNR